MVYDMSVVVPARLDRKLLLELDKLVSRGLYVSRSDAVRDAVRRIVVQATEKEINYPVLHRLVADTASYFIVANMKTVTDVILYGSVARGESDGESDIDLLVLVSDGEEWESESKLYDLLYPVMLSSEQVLTIYVLKRGTYRKLFFGGSSFARSIAKEGVQLHGSILDEIRG